MRWRRALEQFSKRFDRETSISYKTTHGERIDGIVARNREKAHPVRHDDMLALTHYSKARLFQSPDRLQMIDPR